MAKRSIDIVITGEDRSGTALASAKANVARYADDIKRIQQNVRVGGDAFGGGLDKAQQRLAAARQKEFYAEQADLPRLAMEENKRFDKERYDAIRASVMGQEQFDTVPRRTGESMKGVARETDKSVEGAIQFGKALIAVRMATEGIHIAAALIEGDFTAAAEAAKRMPIVKQLVEGYEAGKHLGTAIAKGIDEGLGGKDSVMVRLAEQGLAAKLDLGRATADTWKEARFARMGGEDKDLENLGESRSKALEEIENKWRAALLVMSAETAAATAAAARDAVNSKYDAMEEAINKRKDGVMLAARDADAALFAGAFKGATAKATWVRDTIEGLKKENAEFGMDASQKILARMEKDASLPTWMKAKGLFDERDRQRAKAKQMEDVSDTQAFTMQQEADAQERRLAMEKGTAEEIAKLRIETTKTGIDKDIALLDLKRQKELKDAEDTGANIKAIKEKYGLQEQVIRQGYRETAGPEIRDLRALGGGVAAQDAGYLTGIGKYSAEGKTPTATEKTAERTAKAVEKIAMDGEVLRELLRRAFGPPQVANL